MKRSDGFGRCNRHMTLVLSWQVIVEGDLKELVPAQCLELFPPAILWQAQALVRVPGVLEERPQMQSGYPYKAFLKRICPSVRLLAPQAPRPHEV